jgi:hypothetical protein
MEARPSAIPAMAVAILALAMVETAAAIPESVMAGEIMVAEIQVMGAVAILAMVAEIRATAVEIGTAGWRIRWEERIRRLRTEAELTRAHCNCAIRCRGFLRAILRKRDRPVRRQTRKSHKRRSNELAQAYLVGGCNAIVMRKWLGANRVFE